MTDSETPNSEAANSEATNSETTDSGQTNPETVAETELVARQYVLDAHEETVASVLRCADSVAATWDDDSVAGRAAVVEPLSSELRERGLLAHFPAMLAGAVSATDFSMQATPVPAPPYVAITSRGPVLRATLSAGRLVVALRVFDVIRAEETRYVRGTDDPREAVSVAFR